MGFLTTGGYKDLKQGFTPLPEGDYEVYAKEYEIGKSTKKGTPFTKFKFVVREDIEQEGKKRTLFHPFWHTENTVGIVMGFLKELNVPEGVSFESQEQFAQYVLHKPVKAHVIQSTYEAKDGTIKPQNEIKYFKLTEYPNFRPVAVQDKSEQVSGLAANDPFADDGKPIEISDEDLPF